jgi:transposase
MSKQPLSDFIRTQIVVEATQLHTKHTTLARKYHCSTKTVQRILQRYRTDQSIQLPPRPGRSLSLTDDQIQTLRNIIRLNCNVTSSYHSTLFFRATGVSLCARSLRIYRHLLNFTPRKRRFRLFMTKAQKRARHLYAVEHQHDNIKKWVFEDETSVVIQKTGELLWVERGNPTPPRVLSDEKAKVKIWGVVRWTGKTLSIVRGRGNSNTYIKWLSTHFARETPRLEDCLFIQDRCSWHKPIRVKKWIEDHGMEMVLNPVRSPEFNAIEYVWAWIKHYITEQHPNDQASLEAATRKAFVAIEQKTIQHDFQHVQHLLQQEAKK